MSVGSLFINSSLKPYDNLFVNSITAEQGTFSNIYTPSISPTTSNIAVHGEIDMNNNNIINVNTLIAEHIEGSLDTPNIEVNTITSYNTGTIILESSTVLNGPMDANSQSISNIEDIDTSYTYTDNLASNHNTFIQISAPTDLGNNSLLDAAYYGFYQLSSVQTYLSAPGQSVNTGYPITGWVINSGSCISTDGTNLIISQPGLYSFLLYVSGMMISTDILYTVELDISGVYQYGTACIPDTSNYIMWQLSPQIFETANTSIMITTPTPPPDVPTGFELYVTQIFVSSN